MFIGISVRISSHPTHLISVISNHTWLGKPKNQCVVFEQNVSIELNSWNAKYEYSSG